MAKENKKQCKSTDSLNLHVQLRNAHGIEIVGFSLLYCIVESVRFNMSYQLLWKHSQPLSTILIEKSSHQEVHLIVCKEAEERVCGTC